MCVCVCVCVCVLRYTACLSNVGLYVMFTMQVKVVSVDSDEAVERERGGGREIERERGTTCQCKHVTCKQSH